MLILQVTDIRRRLRRYGFNPQVLSDMLVVAVGHLVFGDQVEGIVMTQGARRIRIEEGELPSLVKQARGLLSYDFDPRRKMQNQWWFVQGMPVLTTPKPDVGTEREKPVEKFLDSSYILEVIEGQPAARTTT